MAPAEQEAYVAELADERRHKSVALEVGEELIVDVTEDVVERFYAISVERKVRHPAVAAVCQQARAQLFA